MLSPHPVPSLWLPQVHEEVCVDVVHAGYIASVDIERRRARALHLVQLEMMEALLAAGYRPITYRRYKKPHSSTVLADYFPPGDPELARRWELDSAGRWE